MQQAQPQQPQLEECKTDSGKTENTEGGMSEGAQSSGPIRAPPYSHVRSLSGGSSVGGEACRMLCLSGRILVAEQAMGARLPRQASCASRKPTHCPLL